MRFPITVIKTQGDEFQGVELFKRGGVGVFTKALERALLEGRIDIAVHSLKDLPVDQAEGLFLGAFPRREDVRDVLVTASGTALNRLPKGATVGTGSPRRKAQVLKLRPDLKLVDIRGNLDTRVNQVVREKKYAAIVVAAAGLKRIQRYLRYARPIPAESFFPAVAQAALGIQMRLGDERVRRVVRTLNHRPTERVVSAERSLLKALRGGCRVPVGVVCRLRGSRMRLRARVFSLDGKKCIEGSLEGKASSAEVLGVKLAAKLLSRGAGRFLKEARA